MSQGGLLKAILDALTGGGGGAASSKVQGADANDAAVTGNPVVIGGRADATTPASVNDGDATYLFTDTEGRVQVKAQGVVADNTASPGNPVQMGAIAADPVSLPAAATAGRGVNFLTDLLRRLIVLAVPLGAANLANTQVTAGAAASTLAIARPTRREVIFKNIDTSNAVWIGGATVTVLNGTQVIPGESIPYTFVGLIQVIAPAGAPIVCVRDEYY